jgi:uncharacterized phage-associated protein
MKIERTKLCIPKIEDIVYFFLLKKPMSQKKVQKLVYYSQAFSLVLLDRDIVDGINFEAWVHGPVNTIIRSMLAEYGWDDIKVLVPSGKTLSQLRKENRELFSTDVLEVLDEIWRVYGPLSANQLELLTHSEEPWLEQRGDIDPLINCTKVISNETIKRYYRNNVEK